MPPTPRWMMLTSTSCCGSFAISSSIASSEPATSALTHEAELLDGALLGELEDVLERDLAPRAARERLGLQAVGALAGELARAALVLDHAHVLARLGHAVEAEHLDRLAGRRALELALPMKSCIARTRPKWAPATSASPTRSVPRWIRTVTTGPRPGSSLDSITAPEASASRVGLQLLEVGDDLDRVEQRVEALVGLRADVDELDLPAPLRRLQAVLGHLGAHALGLRALLVDLVDRHDDRHFGGLGVVDRLLGLRLDAVVGGDDDHREVGDAGAAGAHRGERLVARACRGR